MNKLHYNHSLKNICDNFLNDSYLTIYISKSLQVELVFYPVKTVDNKLWKITFSCSSFITFNTDTTNLLDILLDSIFIVYAKIDKIPIKSFLKNCHDSRIRKSNFHKDTKIIYSINLEGSINFEIKCLDFIWEMEKISEKEYSNLYFNK